MTIIFALMVILFLTLLVTTIINLYDLAIFTKLISWAPIWLAACSLFRFTTLPYIIFDIIVNIGAVQVFNYYYIA